MNSRAHPAFPSTDNALGILLVGGLTLASALFVATQSIQVFVA